MKKIADNIIKTGLGVLDGVYGASEIREMRALVTDNLSYMSNTRPTPSARHLAGFHRFPRFESLHCRLTQRPEINEVLRTLCGEDFRNIGLTDITVNRSQPWHKDLLRGEFSHYLQGQLNWGQGGHHLFKVLLYLQDSSSLRYVPGSHLRQVSLESDEHAVPDDHEKVRSAKVKAGDVVFIDLRLTHRGSSEADFADPVCERTPKILVSTVCGSSQCSYIDAMEAGNAMRTIAWTRRYLTGTGNGT